MNFGPLEYAAHCRRRQVPAPGAEPPQAVAPAVRVFEAVVASGGRRSPAAKSLCVRVKAESRPVVLVLSAREPVIWRLELAPGTSLRGVLLAGDGEARVHGAGDAKVVPIGSVCVFRRSARVFRELERQVLRLTGARIGGFQSVFAAETVSFRAS